MQNKALIFTILIAITLVAPSVMAATTLSVPVAGTNYTTLTWECTTGINSTTNDNNVTIYYNVSGGATGTLLELKANTSADQSDFSSTISIESLSDALTYNFTCYADNGTDQEWSTSNAKVGIDNTDPTYTFVLTKPSRANFKGTQRLSWTTADATSGVETVAVTVTSPNTDTCTTQSWSTTSGSDTEVKLDCAGDYTAAMTVTDNAGNSVTTTDEFKVYAPGEKVVSDDGTVSFGAFSIFGEGEEAKGSLKVIAVIALIVLIIWGLGKK